MSARAAVLVSMAHPALGRACHPVESGSPALKARKAQALDILNSTWRAAVLSCCLPLSSPFYRWRIRARRSQVSDQGL